MVCVGQSQYIRITSQVIERLLKGAGILEMVPKKDLLGDKEPCWQVHKNCSWPSKAAKRTPKCHSVSSHPKTVHWNWEEKSLSLAIALHFLWCSFWAKLKISSQRAKEEYFQGLNLLIQNEAKGCKCVPKRQYVHTGIGITLTDLEVSPPVQVRKSVSKATVFTLTTSLAWQCY